MTTHETGLDAEDVLAHLDWVQGLARSLVRDPGLADDVAQETWLAALRHPGPSAHGEGSLRAWLGRITRNVVLQQNRGAGIRRDHEGRASRVDELPSTGELVGRVGVQRTVVDAVLALDEPYRRTILLRYFEGLAPKAIAARTGAPVATVKTHLARGLAALRRKLDAEFGGDGRAWLRALAPLVPYASSKALVGLAAAALVLVLGGWWGMRAWDARDLRAPLAISPSEVALAESKAPEPLAASSGAEPTAARQLAPGSETAPGVEAVSAAGDALIVEVVDTDGLPVGGVALEIGAKLGETDGGSSLSDVTDADGRLRVADLGQKLQNLAEADRLIVSLNVPLASPIEQRFDPAALPEEPVRLVLPPTGGLRVELRDGAGQPVEGGVYVTPLLEEVAYPGGVIRGHRGTGRTVEGVACFPHVPLDLELRIQADPDGQSGRNVTEQVLTGPASRDEVVSCSFELTNPYPTLRGRLLGPDGAPLARVSVSGEVVHDPAVPEFRVFTDEEGAFEALVEVESTTAGTRMLRLMTKRSPYLAAEVEVTWPESGDVELGTVTLAARPIFARGHVVHADGEPVYWAAVRVKRKVSWNNEQGFQWHHANEYMTMSEKDGSFELVGELGEGEFVVLATESGYVDARLQPLQAGSEDLVLVLEREGQIAGSVLLDEDVDPRWLHVTAEPQEEPARFSFSGDPDYVPNDRLLADGNFLVSHLPAGPADVSLHLTGQPPLALFEDVQVESGEATHDPRLQQLDLRSLLRRITVHATDAAGTPLAYGHVAFDLGERIHHVLLDQGSASILTTDTAVDAEVFAPGYLPETLVGLTGNTEVGLAPGHRVHLRLPLDAPLPEPGIELRATLIPQEFVQRVEETRLHTADGNSLRRWRTWRFDVEAPFDADRKVVVTTFASGPHQVLWAVYVPSADPHARPWSYALSSSSPVEVEAGEALLEVAPDPEAYEHALEKAREFRNR